MEDEGGPWISVREDGVDGDGGDDISHFLTRGLEMVRTGKVDDELKPELDRIVAAIEAREAANDAPATRREKIRAATAALEDVKPGELRTIEPFPDEEPGYHRFRYVAADGTAVGGNYTIDGGPPPILEGFNVGDTNNPVKLGAKEVRKLFAEIRRQHPEIERIHAFRMTGARAEAEELWIDLAGKGQGTKPEDVDIHVGDPVEEDAPALDRGGEVDPAIATRNRQLAELKAAAPLRAAGDVDQRGEIGLELFDSADQDDFKFRFGEEDAATMSDAELLADIEADAKAIEALRGCL